MIHEGNHGINVISSYQAYHSFFFDCVPHTTLVLASIHMCSRTSAEAAQAAQAEASSGGGATGEQPHMI